MRSAGKPLSIFLACATAEMERERSYLDSVVLGILQKKFGAVELCWSTPAATGEALREELALVRRADFFVALVGESRGPNWPCPPGERSQFPPEMLGQSQFEIEVRTARERADPSFIYFRAEDFEEPEPPASSHPAGDAAPSPGESAQLKQWIQEVWTVRAPYRSLEELEALLLEDLETALSDRDRSPKEIEAPVPPPPEHPPDEEAPPEPYLDENVQFTVFRPDVVVPKEWHPLIVFAHLSKKRSDAPEDEPDPLEEVQRQARKALEDRFEDYQDLTQDSSQGVPLEGELTFVPLINEITFNPAQRKFLWTEPVHREEFRMLTEAQPGKTLRGSLTVFLGRIILAEIRLTIRVVGSSSGSKPAPPASANPYRKIFASYSHKDQDIAEEFARTARAFGDRYLRDITDLRAGEVWSERLLDLIDEADVFQLLWSSNSMRSPYVRREWEHALSLGRANFIRPTFWEQPMPAAPAENLPPAELLRLQFIPLVGGPPASATLFAGKPDRGSASPRSAPAGRTRPPRPALKPSSTAAPVPSPPSPGSPPIARPETPTARGSAGPAPARSRKRGLTGVLAAAAALVLGGLFLNFFLLGTSPSTIPDRLAALEESVRTSTTPSKVLPELIGLVNGPATASFSTADQERLARAAITLSRRLEKVAIEKNNDERASQATEAASLAEKAAKRSGKPDLEHEVFRLQQDVNHTRQTLLYQQANPGYDNL